MSEPSLNIPIENERRVLITLYKVSLEGDVVALERLLEQDELVLDRFSSVTSYNETSLHIAVMRGHLDFARALLHHNPQLAGESDSFRRLPLHWAAEKGYTNIVTELLQKSSPDHKDACLSQDQDGKIPLHLAAMKGRNDVVKELIRDRPESVLEKVENGGRILHLCVKYNKLEALKLLVETTQAHELVNEKDDHGNTILHLAVIFKQVEIMKYLVSDDQRTNIDANATNMNGFTALDSVEHSPIDSKSLEIKILLLEKNNNSLFSNSNNSAPSTRSSGGGCLLNFYGKCKKWWRTYIHKIGERLEKARGNILVAASVTASMAFQAGINPPNFIYKAPDQKNIVQITNNAAAAAADLAPDPSDTRSPFLRVLFADMDLGFWFYNTLSLLLSLAIMMFMLSGIPFRNMFSSFALVIAMEAIVFSTTTAYVLTADKNLFEDNGWGDTLLLMITYIGTYVVPLMCLFIIFIHFCPFVFSMFFKIFKCLKKLIIV